MQKGGQQKAATPNVTPKPAPAAPKADKMHPETVAGVKRGKPMTHEEADRSRSNPNYAESREYRINCQTCVVAYEMRRRGYDVEAKPKCTEEQDALARLTNLAWIEPGGNSWDHPSLTPIQATNTNGVYRQLESMVKPGERYTFQLKWKNKNKGHIIHLRRNDDGRLEFFDPQTSRTDTGKDAILDYLKEVQIYSRKGYGPKPGPTYFCQVLRVDDKEPDMRMVDKILKPTRSSQFKQDLPKPSKAYEELQQKHIDWSKNFIQRLKSHTVTPSMGSPRRGKIKQRYLPEDEYAHVMSELMTNMTKEERKADSVTSFIGDYRYSFIKDPWSDGSYICVGKRKITGRIHEEFKRWRETHGEAAIL